MLTRLIQGAKCIAALFLLTAAVSPARADLTIFVEEPYGGLGAVQPGGHAAVYFNGICADTPTHLRACQPGESGVVLARYDGIEKLDWVAIPLVPYLYAVDDVSEVPAWVTREQVERLREQYRREHLLAVAPNVRVNADGSVVAPRSNWYELVGSAFDRKLYGFRVKTTAADDAHLMELMYDRPNRERYNGEFTNCADFVRVIFNRYYPKALHRNFIADLGVTSPKQLAHGLTKYARTHPELDLHEFTIAQVPGTIERSKAPKGVLEAVATSLKYEVPLAVFEPVAAGVAMTAYLARGRFTMPNAPALTLEQIATMSGAAGVDGPLAETPVMTSTTLSADLIRTHAPVN